MPEVRIGINILETLTTGMYRDPFVMYREYIQNSCDAIDEAVSRNLIAPEDGRVDIWLDDDKVTIEDNGIGIPGESFVTTLYSIGDSDKSSNLNKGFRGIGHWCGLANCERITFTSKAAGENAESVMTCDAEKIRAMMLEHRLKTKLYSIDNVLSATIKFSTNPVNDISKHYFRVEMERLEGEEICDLQKIKEYLSFVAPVGYAGGFIHKDKIIEYAEAIGYEIPEYNIYIQGEAILKKYQLTFDTRSKGEDKIFSVKFEDITDSNGNLMAWLWYGVSTFKAQILSGCKMRDIRLRCKNIQLGGENTLQSLFSEARGLYYFVGEVFAVSNDLIPDSQRDYFEPCNARTEFDKALSLIFQKLKDVYYCGSAINSAFSKLEKSKQKLAEAEERSNGDGIWQDDISALKNDVDKAERNVEKVHKKLSDVKVTSEIYDHVKKQFTESSTKHKSSKAHNKTDEQMDKKDFSEKEKVRMVPLEKIIKILEEMLDDVTAAKIVKKIQESK